MVVRRDGGVGGRWGFILPASPVGVNDDASY